MLILYELGADVRGDCRREGLGGDKSFSGRFILNPRVYGGGGMTREDGILVPWIMKRWVET